MIARRMFDYPTWGRSAFSELERMKQDMERLATGLVGRWGRESAGAGVFPPLNLTEDKDGYIIRAELPGMDTKDLDLQATGSSLTITGERRISAEEGARYHRREREAGKFSRVINLPNAVDQNRINASLQNGILTVKIPKTEAAKPRQITIS